jgi:hypothetical protein
MEIRHFLASIGMRFVTLKSGASFQDLLFLFVNLPEGIANQPLCVQLTGFC